ncbi:hypothetical protein BC938DRAFT_478899 [Jimgerdemannia flammicorona]|uniref:Uncharacterized protein n=1 Tax=Jimgerdemannia flammicorona TaxID=994334 RepID=A0A433QM46_9FUNG|nr:hypothetical protein BC938DRAFT_478899 [Jimgerdemannia flammicorona]
MLEAIKLMKDSNMELIILSDSNTVYIGIILKAYGVSDLFTAAITNPGHFDDAGRLHIRRRVPPEEPHGCTMGCALNICKGGRMDTEGTTSAPRRDSQAKFVTPCRVANDTLTTTISTSQFFKWVLLSVWHQTLSTYFHLDFRMYIYFIHVKVEDDRCS